MFGWGRDDSATVVRLIAEQVRRDISFGVLPPDTKLKIEELRQRYGGSAHSMREALTLLASDGLVEANAQRGFRVAIFSISLGAIREPRALTPFTARSAA